MNTTTKEELQEIFDDFEYHYHDDDEYLYPHEGRFVEVFLAGIGVMLVITILILLSTGTH